MAYVSSGDLHESCGRGGLSKAFIDRGFYILAKGKDSKKYGNGKTQGNFRYWWWVVYKDGAYSSTWIAFDNVQNKPKC